MGLPRSALMLVLVTLMLVPALEWSYGQNDYSHAVPPGQPSPPSNFTPSQSYPSTDDTILLEQQMRSLDGNIDSAKAMAIAQTSVEFQVAAIGHEVHFSSIFLLFSSSLDSKGTPAVVLTSVNVVFSYRDVGPWANIVVTLNPTLTQVTNITVQLILFTSHPPAILSLGKS